MPEKPPLFDVKLKRIVACHDPELHIFRIELFNPKAIWREAWGSEAELRAFIKGLEAGAGMLGYFLPHIEIPMNVAEDDEFEAEHA
jgi:hypothetical protein